MNSAVNGFLKKYAFLHVSTEVSLAFGDEFCLYTNQSMQIKITSDRGKLSIDISPLRKTRWLDPFKKILEINPDYVIKTGSLSEAIAILDEYWDGFSTSVALMN